MRKLTEAQKESRDNRRKKFKQLAAQVAAMSDAERAELAKRMGALVTCAGNTLSIKNSCLLFFQCPTATMVGGFRQWLSAGRAVLKGERGHMIWVPIDIGASRTGQDSETETDEDAVPEEGGGRAFVPGTVFDITQTVALDPSNLSDSSEP